MELLFPHDQIRPIQKEIIDTILKETSNGNSLVMHAPTGLGKTAASLAPILTNAIETNKTIFFLTSKNTQHKIAIETLQAIKSKFDITVPAADIVGKKWMCIQPGISLLSTNEFNEYCKALREDDKCEFYSNVKKGEQLTAETRIALDELSSLGPVVVEKIVEKGTEHKLCPYELGMLLAKQAKVIIADYYYLFHPRIRDTFLKKNNKELEDCIIIVDEGHNLPNRVKDLASERLSTTLLKRSITESKKFKYDNITSVLEKILKIITDLSPNDESLISREAFMNRVAEIVDYNELIKECETAGDHIREEQKSSAVGAIGLFLEGWLGKDDGFVRIISKKKGIQQDVTTLSYRCLDPSIIAKEVITKSHATILMSGTLTPTKMYSELLGFPETTVLEEYPSPFPKENRLNLIVAKTSTKYTTRSNEQYEEIGKIITDIINATPGNSAIFFPSYFLKEQVDKYLTKIEKTVFHERQEMTKVEKEEMIDKFRSYQKTGAALLAVVAGSFGEGIDLPGDELKTVVVVGLPLAKPDLETEALIKYYDAKFKNGWNYGYLFPAFNKVIQNAGRCIRSATDRGVVVFLDERFTWPQYYRCFPSDWKIKVVVNQYKEKVEKFFSGK